MKKKRPIWVREDTHRPRSVPPEPISYELAPNATLHIHSRTKERHRKWV
jgi:hypothetical protein